MRLPTQPDPLATPCHQKCFAQILARHKCTPGACRICRLLQNDADNEASLTNAAEKGFAYCLASLIDAGVAPDVADARGLSRCITRPATGACVELLLAAGAGQPREPRGRGSRPSTVRRSEGTSSVCACCWKRAAIPTGAIITASRR